MFRTSSLTALLAALLPALGLPPAAAQPAPALDAYQVRPLTDTMILPYWPGRLGEPTQTVRMVAAGGQYEPTSLVLRSPHTAERVLITATDLHGPGGVLSAEHVDIRWVKTWYQAGTAPWGGDQDRSRRVLVPELLLKDPELVRVDRREQRNWLRLNPPGGPVERTDITEPVDIPWATHHPYESFWVQDAAELQPIELAASENQQVLVTVHVPEDLPPGEYTGALEITADAAPVESLTLAVQVLPFALPAPGVRRDPDLPFMVSMYYWGQLDAHGDGAMGFRWRNEEQMRGELRLMREHGIRTPAICLIAQIAYNDEAWFRRNLQLLQEEGFAGGSLFLASSDAVGDPTEPEKLAELQENVRRTIAIAREYDFTEVYFYGIDELYGDPLLAQRPAWQAVKEAGGKLFVSGGRGHFEAVGDLLDVLNWSGKPNPDEPAKWHSVGSRIWVYSYPQTPPEAPELFRRNCGLLLWLLDYDGTCTYCFTDGHWNDFGQPSYRGHNIAYSTVDGAIPTLALAGFRAGADDVRYATLLQQRLTAAQAADDPAQRQVAQQAEAWLAALDLDTADLYEVREQMIAWILALGEAQ